MKSVATIALLAVICNLLIAPVALAAGSSQAPQPGKPPADKGPREWSTPTSHHVRNADGSVTAEIYASPAFYQDNSGKWQEIRNEVVREGTRPGFPWKNRANAFAVAFADGVGRGAALRLDLGELWLEYGPAVSGASAPSVSGDKVKYPGAGNGLDLVYTALPDGVEEEIILASAKAGNVFTFFVVTNATAVLESDGSVGFYDASGAKVWSIQSLLMWDSAGAESDALSYTRVEPRGNRVEITLEADAAWLADPARVYPVTIDPTISIQPDPASGMDAYISGLTGYTTTNYGGETEVRVGNATVSGNHAVYRGLLKFNLSSIPRSVITDARLDVYKAYGSAPSARNVEFTLSTLTTPWLESEVTWAKATQATAWAAVGADFVDQAICAMTINADSTAGWYSSPSPASSTLAAVISGWVNGNSANCGLLMKRAEEPSADTVEVRFRSSDYADRALRPKLTVTYIEDTTPPVVEILAPAAGALLSGSCTVSASVADAGEAPTGVDRVEFYVDGGLRATLAEPPYAFAWDTAVETNGAHSLAVKAYDKAGNVGQLSQAILLSDSFTNLEMIDSGLTTAAVDCAAGAARLAGTQTQATVTSAAASSTLSQPSYPLSYLTDGSTGTVWKSAGKTSASGTETINLNWTSTWPIAYVVITPANVADGLQAKVELLDSSGAVVKTTPYQTLASSPTYICTDRTNARSARVTFTNLTPDPISGQFHANISEVQVRRYYLDSYYVDTRLGWGHYTTGERTREGGSWGTPIEVGSYDLFYYILSSVQPSDSYAYVGYSAPNSWVGFSGGSPNSTEYSSMTAGADYPDTSTHTVSWSDWDRKYGDSSSPSDWSGQAWVSTNSAGHYTDCWVSNWWAETRSISWRILISRDWWDYSAHVDWDGYHRDTYYRTTYPAVSVTVSANEQYSFTYPAANAIDGNANTAWVSYGQTNRQSSQTLDLTLAAPTRINRLTIKPRMNGMSAKVSAWEGGAWALKSEIPVLVEGSYSFSDTTTDQVRLEFSNLQGSNPYYAGVAEVAVGYAAYSSLGLLVSRPQILSEPATSLTLQVDDSTPTGTSITYEVTADGVNWQVAVPGASLALQNPGSLLALRATLESTISSASPEIRSWQVLKNGEGLAVTIQHDAGDVTPPIVAIVQPVAGSVLNGPVTIKAAAWDDTAVSRVLFMVDGALLATDANAPYEATWEPEPDSGAHQLSAVAYDMAGNASATRAVNVVALTDSFTSTGSLNMQATTAYVDTSAGIVTLPVMMIAGWPTSLVDWQHRRGITLNNSQSYDHTGEPVRVTVSDTLVKDGGADIRVTDPSGTIIPHRVVSFDDVNKTYVIQFEARSVPAQSSRTYYVYYDNPGASTTSVSTSETAYDPLTPLASQHVSRYAFWRNDLYFEAYGIGTAKHLFGSKSASVALGFAWPYAAETTTSSAINTTSSVYYSTKGRAHVGSTGSTTGTLDPAGTSTAQWVAWLNSDQYGEAGYGAKAASGNLPQGFKLYSSGPDNGGSTVRSGSAILYPNGRVQINVDYGRGASGYTGNPGVRFYTTSCPNYAYWTWAQNACYVVILDPMAVTVGSAEPKSSYPPSKLVQSLPVAANQRVLAATVTATEGLPAGTAITYDISADGGQTWQVATLGQPCALTTTGQTIVLRATLTTTDSSATPTLFDWTVTINEATEVIVTVSGGGPCAPSSLAATAQSGQRPIDLAWEASPTPGVTYNVYRGTATGFPLDSEHQLVSGLAGTAWSDTTCTQGVGYYYRVTAVLGTDASLPTNEAGAVSGLPEAGPDRLGLEDFWAFAGFGLGADQGYVNAATGNLVVTSTDLALPAPSIGVVIRRSYNSMSNADLGYGFGWNLNANYRLSENEAGDVALTEGDSSVHVFTRNPDGTYTRPAGVYMELTKLPDGTFSILRKDGLTYSFDTSGKITDIADRNGNTLAYSYTTLPGVGDRLTSITDPVGRVVTMTYNAVGRLTEAEDWGGRAYTYAYDVSGNLASVTDPAGGQILYTYDAYHQLTAVSDKVGNETLVSLVGGKCRAITDALGQVTTLTYDPVARRTTVTDPRHNDTVFDLDAAGRLIERTDALDRTTSFQYDADSNLTRLTDIWNNTWLYDYDSYGNMVEANDPSGTTTVTAFNEFNLPDQVSVYGAPDRLTLLKDTQSTYDVNGNVLTVSDSIDAGQGVYRTTTYEYDPARPGFIGTVTDFGGGTAEYTYDVYGCLHTVTRHVTIPGVGLQAVVAHTAYDSLGNLVSATDPNGSVISYEYDPMGRLVRTVLPDGTVARTTYDAQGRVLTKTDGNGGRTTYEYDRLGRAVVVTDPLGNETAASYDDANNKASITKPGGILSTYEYDQIGRLERILDGLGRAMVYSYDPTQNKVRINDPEGRWESGTYDFRSLLTAYTNADGTTTIAYDRLGRKTSVTDPNNKVITYAYDDPGRLLSVTDPMGEVITYEYDDSDNMTRMTTRVRDALGQHIDRLTTYAYDELNRRLSVTLPDLQGTGLTSSSFTYDANGNQVTRTDGKGQTTNYVYDSMGRLFQVLYSSGAEVSYTYDGVGNPLTMRDSAGTTTWRYDTLNRVTSETDPFGRVVRYAFDDAERTATLTADWGTITYQGNTLGQLQTVTDPSGGATGYQYDLSGKCTQVSYPNGDVITSAYDDLGRLTEIKGMHGPTVISDYDYTYDAAGNRLTMMDSAGTTSYEYDNDYRLTKVTRPDTSYTEYQYDEAGNRTQMAVTSGGATDTTTYAYDPDDRLTQVTLTRATHPESTETTYEYDANGNQLRIVEPSGTTVFTYDEENRLTGIGYPTGVTMEYQYDGQGRRLRMKDTNVEVFYQYDGEQVISERDGAGASIVYYVRSLGGTLISNTQTAGTRYYHFDGLGSVVALTDSSGAKVASYTCDEFGVVKQASGQSWNSFGYAGSIRDTVPGLYLMGSRYYDPALGRFITQDTWAGNAYEPWTKNLYSYGRGNPVNYIDPTGHEAAAVELVKYGAPLAATLTFLTPFAVPVLIVGVIAYAAFNLPASDTVTWDDVKGLTDPFDYVPEEWRDIVRRASVEAELRQTPPGGMYLYRYWGGEQPDKLSYWYSPIKYGSAETARKMLALPDKNKATNVTVYFMPAGTPYLWSIAADMTDVPEYGPYATGGGPQIYIRNPEVLIRVPLGSEGGYME